MEELNQSLGPQNKGSIPTGALGLENIIAATVIHVVTGSTWKRPVAGVSKK